MTCLLRTVGGMEAGGGHPHVEPTWVRRELAKPASPRRTTKICDFGPDRIHGESVPGELFRAAVATKFFFFWINS